MPLDNLTLLAVNLSSFVDPFVNFWILMGMFVSLMIPIFAIPYVFFKMGSVAGKIQGKINSMGKGIAKEGYKKNPLAREAAMRKQARESAAQRRFIEGKGLGGKIGKGRRSLSNLSTTGPLGSLRPNAKAGNLAMTEQLQEQRQKMEDARTATMKNAVVKSAGLNYAPLVGQMRKNETGAAFATRYAAETGQTLSSDDANALEGLRGQFSNQIGTTEFARASLLASHDLGSSAAHINHATGRYAGQMQADGKNDLEISNEVAGVLDASAKAGGVYSMSGAGWSAGTGYSQFGAKDADRIIASADFNKFDSGQFGTNRTITGKLDTGALTGDEHALARSVLSQLSSTNPSDRAAMLKRVADARGSKAFADLSTLVDSAGLSAELNDMIAGFK